MPSFDVDAESITVFRIDETYFFSHYFDRQDIFAELRDYYNEGKYRFEVPADEFEAVQQRLEDDYFEVRVVDDLEPYCVVIDKYDQHAEILRDSVVDWERRGNRFFLMKDEFAVREALERGAEKLADTEFVLGL